MKLKPCPFCGEIPDMWFDKALAFCTDEIKGITVEEIEKIIERQKWTIAKKAISGEQHIQPSKIFATAIHKFLMERIGEK